MMALPWHTGLVRLEPGELMPVPRKWRLPGADKAVRCPMKLQAGFGVQCSARECWLPLLPPGNAKGMGPKCCWYQHCHTPLRLWGTWFGTFV